MSTDTEIEAILEMSDEDLQAVLDADPVLNASIERLQKVLHAGVAESRRNRLREALADYAHDAWGGWMKYMFTRMERNDDGTATMPKWAVDRWTGQMNKNYCDLIEDMKTLDREEADKMIAIFNQSQRGIKNDSFFRRNL